jgi:hypothetical protein
MELSATKKKANRKNHGVQVNRTGPIFLLHRSVSNAIRHARIYKQVRNLQAPSFFSPPEDDKMTLLVDETAA